MKILIELFLVILFIKNDYEDFINLLFYMLLMEICALKFVDKTLRI